jgi:hypothetical protein
MLDIPVKVLVVVPPGENTDLEAGPMADSPGQFHVLETGQVEETLATLS